MSFNLLGLEGDVAVASAVGHLTGIFLGNAQAVDMPVVSLYLADAVLWNIMRVNVDLQCPILSF
jgi:hypothetical protein